MSTGFDWSTVYNRYMMESTNFMRRFTSNNEIRLDNQSTIEFRSAPAAAEHVNVQFTIDEMEPSRVARAEPTLLEAWAD